MTDERRPRRRRKVQVVTMTDVAKRAQVSPSTVSLYLRRPEAVSAHAGEAIQAAITRLDYVPNMIAGGLAAASSRVVGVIVPSVKNAFFAETVSALQRELGRARLQTLLGHSEYDHRVEEELVRAALSWTPAAMVITGLRHNAATVRMLRSSNVPVVQIWELGAETPIDMAVGFHHEQAGAMAARHLIARGRKTLIYLSSRTHQDKRAADRAAGFLATAAELGIPARHITHPGAATTELGGTLFSQLLAEGGDHDRIGVGCSNDWIALGVLFEAQRRGKRIPEDYAVIGFGDLPFAGSCNPALSTIRPPSELIGHETARLITTRLRCENAPYATSIDTGFSEIHRQST